MPRTKKTKTVTKTRTNWRELAEASMERERNWALLTEQLTQRVHDVEEQRGYSEVLLRQASQNATLFERQGRHIKALYATLIDRYVGTKLDTQQFNFAQAQQFGANEHASLERSLNEIQQRVEFEFSNTAQLEASPR